MNLCGQAVGNDKPLFLIAGPCQVESQEVMMECARTLAIIRDRLGILVIFKASFDKANRTSSASCRGVGIEDGLSMLAYIGARYGLPVITDLHEIDQIKRVADVVDILQTPALLCRQTDFIQSVAAAGKPMLLKKGQFLAPEDMEHVVAKCAAAGNDQVMICERGTTFGYHNLIVDMRGLAKMNAFAPVVLDVSHSSQTPSGEGSRSGGDRAMIPVLARAGVAVGVAGIFMEIHPDPANALSDGPSSLILDDLPSLIEQLAEMDKLVKRER